MSAEPVLGDPEATLRTEVTELLRRLIACDTSNPPGREAAAAAVIEELASAAGLECERLATTRNGRT